MIMIIILILYFSLTKELIINKELTIMVLIIIPGQSSAGDCLSHG